MQHDRIDFTILRELQQNARITNIELAQKAGLSPSACSRRVEQLEKSGVIEGYHANISNAAMGHPVTAIVHISLDRQSGSDLDKFEKAAADCPNIAACFLMSGEYDYILRVTARDMEHFEHIHKNWLSNLPGVSRVHSSFAMRTIINQATISMESFGTL